MILDRLPVFLRLNDKGCLVVGGGIVAERKIRLLQRTGASITVVAPTVTAGLQAQIDQGLLQHWPQHYSSLFIKDFWLLVAATDDTALNQRVADDAESAEKFCNVVDDNDASSFILPAIVDRSPVIVAIGTEGNAPVLAQQLKAQIEGWIPERIGLLATQAGRWRELVKKRFVTSRDRRRFWQRFFVGPIAQHLLAGRQAAAEKAMRAELVSDASESTDSHGEAWIVGAGPGDPGLLTIRAQQLIGRADVLLYDRLISKVILDHARKEADFISVGKRAGAHAMSQDAINALLVDLVRQGKRVCRLKGGDPFVFGRGGEEAKALADAGLHFQIVPGISAAMGCAAYAGIPLTLRGISASITLATAKLDADIDPDWPRLLKSGDTLAIYMGSNSVAEIRTALLRNDVSSELPVAFVENGTTQNQRTLLGTVAAMEDIARNNAIGSPCVIYIGVSVAAAEDLQWFEGQSRAEEYSQLIDGEFVAVASM
jgi:uroporphyrin-III C-methyltransferase/precorrin-2 dehydrogenase/sirohydrochlorin ferrochelatase